MAFEVAWGTDRRGQKVCLLVLSSESLVGGGEGRREAERRDFSLVGSLPVWCCRQLASNILKLVSRQDVVLVVG